MYAPQYAMPPGFIPYGYAASPMTPPSSGEEGYFGPRFQYPIYTTTPHKSSGHTRRASHEPRRHAYANPIYAATPAYTTQYAVPKRSDSHKDHSKARMYSVNIDPKSRSGAKKHSSRSPYVDVYVADGNNSPTSSPPPPHEAYYSRGGEQHFTRTTSQKRQDPAKNRTRNRATSYSTPSKPAAQKSRPSTARASPQATPADALAHNIPAGYSLKNWDPTETPILLLGSVFDANSLGKWIYDWTVFTHTPASPLADQAGDLWLNLIQLAGKIKRSEEVLSRVRYQEDFDLLLDFLESGDRLWTRFKRILKTCEEYMWRAARKENGGRKTVSMGANSGKEFVASIFGRDRELENTEKLMQGMRYWVMRFDANCEAILKHPSG